MTDNLEEGELVEHQNAAPADQASKAPDATAPLTANKCPDQVGKSPLSSSPAKAEDGTSDEGLTFREHFR